MNLDLGDIILNKHTASKESLACWKSPDKHKSNQTTKMLQADLEEIGTQARIFQSFMETRD